MRRGTTPTYEITLENVDLESVTDICLAFRQPHAYVYLHLSDGRLTLTEDGVRGTLRQDESNLFMPGTVKRQVKVKFIDGSVGTSDIEQEDVYDVLHVEVL